MNQAEVNLTLRPVKHAFLVNPNDKEALLKAVELSCLLWGGNYNPIIPSFQRLSKEWKQQHSALGKSAKDVIKGYVDAYDPDFLVPLGVCKKQDYGWLKRETILEKSINKKPGEIGYGIGVFDVLNKFYEDELKFVRKNTVDFMTPKFKDSPYRVFLSSVFGKLPNKTEDLVGKYWKKHLSAKESVIEITNYNEYITKLYIRKILSHDIKQEDNFGWSRGECVYFLDPTNPMSVINYWNLRAIGWTVFPFTPQLLDSESAQKQAANFIDTFSGKSNHNKKITYSCSIISDQSIDPKRIKELFKSSPFEKQASKKRLFRTYPRIWDEWARDKDGGTCCRLNAGSQTHDFNENLERIKVRAVNPNFESSHYATKGPKFANRVETSFYLEDLHAEVIPEGGKNLHRTLSSMHFDEWRFSKRATSYLSRYKGTSIYIESPDAEDVFKAWMKDNGLEVKLSGPGRIAKQMVKLLGGKYGINTLADKNLILLLKEMESGKENQIENWMRQETFWQKLCNIAESGSISTNPSKLLKNYIDKKMFKLGVKIQCDTCRRSSWLDISTLDYTVRCKNCFKEFDIPSHSPQDLIWSYKTIGPFRLPNRAAGVLPSLLTLRVFTNVIRRGKITPMFSFETEINNQKMEIDLGLFYRADKYRSEEDSRLVIAECKSMNSFEKKDIKRMEKVSKKFPGAVLVFSTLKSELSEKEKKLLRPLVKKCRKYYKSNEPYNPVMILTETELFAHISLDYTWKEKGGRHEHFLKRFSSGNEVLGICDITQQIYLGMKPWNEWVGSDS